MVVNLTLIPSKLGDIPKNAYLWGNFCYATLPHFYIGIFLLEMVKKGSAWGMQADKSSFFFRECALKNAPMPQCLELTLPTLILRIPTIPTLIPTFPSFRSPIPHSGISTKP